MTPKQIREKELVIYTNKLNEPVNIIGTQKRPCKECPFRLDVKLKRGHVGHYCKLVAENQHRWHLIDHTCHLTDERSDHPNGATLNGGVLRCAGFVKAKNEKRYLIKWLQKIHREAKVYLTQERTNL